MALYVVATPLGNLKDITLRALDTLKNVDLIACEDTRVTRKLLAHYDFHTPLTSYHEHNKKKKESYLIKRLEKGEEIALVSNAGTPIICDPGSSLVQKAIQGGIKVVSIPGPSALISGLVVSGFSGSKFVFVGWLPRKQTKLKQELTNFLQWQYPIIIYESPYRLLKTLKLIQEVFGKVKITIVRELTKIHEEVIQGDIEEVFTTLAQRDRIKGEITLVINPDGQKSKNS